MNAWCVAREKDMWMEKYLRLLEEQQQEAHTILHFPPPPPEYVLHTNIERHGLMCEVYMRICGVHKH